MKTKIYGTDLAKLEGWNDNGFINLRTEFHESESEYISFPIEAVPNLIDFLTSQSAKPEQPSHSCTPCLAEIQDSKHSGANDGEVLINMICPSASQCDDVRCLSREPHAENELCKHTCLLEPGSRYVGQCIQLYEMWLDKELPMNECDPEGMKPKSKYEKAEAVRKYVLGENYRDVKE